jgi:hypothetical protein
MEERNKPRGKPQNENPDLRDNDSDAERLRGNKAFIGLPDVKDIPGQEFIHVPPMGEAADTTLSSADEEGQDIWSDEVPEDESSDVTEFEKTMLEVSANDMPTKDEQQLRRAELDFTDEDGDPLNEKTSANAASGSDLDVPGADDDDLDEKIGEEDEENNQFSLGGDEKSINEERSGT